MTNSIHDRTCLLENSQDGAILRQELVTYKSTGNGVIGNPLRECFFKMDHLKTHLQAHQFSEHQMTSNLNKHESLLKEASGSVEGLRIPIGSALSKSSSSKYRKNSTALNPY